MPISVLGGLFVSGCIVASNELILILPSLDYFSELREIVIVVDPEQELSQVGSALMIVLEITEQLEHLVWLTLEIVF